MAEKPALTAQEISELSRPFFRAMNEAIEDGNPTTRVIAAAMFSVGVILRSNKAKLPADLPLKNALPWVVTGYNYRASQEEATELMRSLTSRRQHR